MIRFLLNFLDSKGHEYLGIIFLSLGANIIAPSIVSQNDYTLIHLIVSLCFITSGVLFLNLSNHLKLIEEDYESESDENLIKKNLWIFNALESKYKLMYLFVACLIAFSWFFIRVNKDTQIYTYAYDTPTLNIVKEDSISLRNYNEIASANKFYKIQANIISKLAQSLPQDSMDLHPIVILDAFCIYCNTISKLQEQSNNKTFIVKSLYSDKASLLGCNKTSKNNSLMCSWSEPQTELEKESIDIAYLFNNTIPVIENSIDAKEIFTNYYSLLKKGGLFVFDVQKLSYNKTFFKNYSSEGKVLSRRIDVNENPNFFNVQYILLDTDGDNDIITSTPHNKQLCNIDELSSLLESVGFKVDVEKTDDTYPYEFIIAKK